MPDPNFDVIVCGSLHLDVMVNAPALPRLDETVVGTRWGYACGGKGANQAVQAAAAGARTAMIGRVGDDDFGRRLLDHLARQGVHAGQVSVDPATGSGMSVAIVDTAGDYGAVIVSGSNLQIDPAGLVDCWQRLGGARILVLQNEVPEAVNIAAAREARLSGGMVLWNAAPARPASPELLELVDLLVVNKVEAAQISGQDVDSPADALLALPLLGARERRVVVTLGAQGLVAGAPGADPIVMSAEPVDVVSSHGAGDCFMGTLAARLASGSTFIDACSQASRAAALHVSAARPGSGG